MSYNGMDRLTRVASPSSTVDYSYDALGRRTGRESGGDTARWHLDAASDATAYITDPAGALTEEMLTGPGGLIAVTDHSGATPETSWYHYNPHGDTSALTDDAGSVTATHRYDAFGNELRANDTSYGYTGKWQRDSDAATGLIRMGVRDYDPALGRFISTDSLRGSMSDPQQRNRYQYTGNNPLTRYDLNGLYWGESWVEGAKDWVDENWYQGAEQAGGYAGDAASAIGGGVKDAANGILFWTENDPLFGSRPGGKDHPIIGAGRDFMPDSVNAFIDFTNDPRVSTSLLIGIGVPGGRWVKCPPSSTRDAKWIKDSLSVLRSGSGSRVKLVDTNFELEELFMRYKQGGTPVRNTTHPELYKLPDGTTVGYRSSSTSGGPAIDITLPDGTYYRIHVQQ
ncbi:MAG: RHS repeat-associated core domain-containing protein [Gaiellales bacterium]|nr:MAG: RHS repeat-associated core domain-containing protein [Gaiellales bacterium]